MKKIEQLMKWVEGESIHDTESDICCPDFSCCKPDNLSHKEERELFIELYLTDKHEEMERMLMMFLGRALSDCGKKVYIVGGKP